MKSNIKEVWNNGTKKEGISLLSLGFSDEDMMNPLPAEVSDYSTRDIKNHYVKLSIWDKYSQLSVLQTEKYINIIGNLDKLILTFIEDREKYQNTDNFKDYLYLESTDFSIRILKEIKGKFGIYDVEGMEDLGTPLSYVQYLLGECYCDDVNYYDIKYTLQIGGLDTSTGDKKLVEIRNITEDRLYDLVNTIIDFNKNCIEELNSFIPSKDTDIDKSTIMNKYSLSNYIGSVVKVYFGYKELPNKELLPRTVIGELYLYEDKYPEKNSFYYRNKGKYFIDGYEEQYVREGKGINGKTLKSYRDLETIEIDKDKVTLIEDNLSDKELLKYYKMLSKNLKNKLSK